MNIRAERPAACVWVGLVEVSPPGEVSALEPGSRAYVWAAVMVNGSEDFLQAVQTAAQELHMRVVAAEDVMPAPRSLRARCNREVARIVRTAGSTPSHVAWGRLHAFDDGDGQG